MTMADQSKPNWWEGSIQAEDDVVRLRQPYCKAKHEVELTYCQSYMAYL